MKILHIFDHSIPLQSGYTFRSRAIINEQRKLGWETGHVTSSKHNLSEASPKIEQVEGLSFYRSPPLSGVQGNLPILNQWQVIRTLERRIEEAITAEQPDIIHAHSPALNGVAAVRAGRKAGIPVVYEVRGLWEDAAVSHGTSSENGLRYKLTRNLETWVLKRANAVTCICEGLKGDIVARGIKPEKITIVPNAVDASRFQPSEGRDQALLNELNLNGKKVLSFIGSFYDYEGLDLLVEAMPLVLKSLPEARLLLVGGGQVEQDIKRQVASMGLEDKVIMTGRVPNHEVERYYSITDVLAYPRKSMRLTDLVTPLKPLEAMAQKCLFVASDVGGHRELVEDGVNGVLFRAGDAADLAEKLVTLLNNEEHWPALKEAGRNYVESDRNWRNSVANLKAIYGQLSEKGIQAC